MLARSSPRRRGVFSLELHLRFVYGFVKCVCVISHPKACTGTPFLDGVLLDEHYVEICQLDCLLWHLCQVTRLARHSSIFAKCAGFSFRRRQWPAWSRAGCLHKKSQLGCSTHLSPTVLFMIWASVGDRRCWTCVWALCVLCLGAPHWWSSMLCSCQLTAIGTTFRKGAGNPCFFIEFFHCATINLPFLFVNFLLCFYTVVFP